jgi:hypothetical protein
VFLLACGSLGLIGLTRFLLVTFRFLPTLSAVVVVFIPLTLHSHHHEFLTQASAVIHSLHSAKLHFVHYFPPLLFPQKNSLLSKKSRQPCGKAVGSRSPHSIVRAIRACHPRSTRSRLAPLHSAGKKLLRYRSANFYRSVPAQGCFTCV